MKFSKLLFLFACFSSLFAQKSMEIQTVSDISKIHFATLWDSLPSHHFIQLEPHKGERSPYVSKFWIGADGENIYFRMRCYQPKNSVVARIQMRDNLSKSDDGIVLQLDTFNDGRSGYGFYINPIGTMTDFRISDDGRNTDTNWDAEWVGTSRITDDGWQAEITIPFTSIKYDDQIHTWGFNVGRLVRENFEDSWWSGELNDDFRVSQGGRLTGIQAPKRQATISLYPYAAGRLESDDQKNLDNALAGDAGIDFRWQIQSNLQANLTYNPDFATVEGDREKINLTRYELSYPEKRLFFQEGNDMFSTRIKTFYSRRIGDIDYGGKLTGKIGAYNMNILSVKSSADSELDTLGAFFTAARFKRDILKSSAVGFSFTDKSWKGGYARSFGLDYVLNLGSSWKLTGQFVTSAPGDWKRNSGYFVRFARESNIYHYHLRFTSLGNDFRENLNQTGFVVDDDRQELDSDVSYRWWVGKDNLIQYIYAASRNNVFWSQSGTLRSWYFTQNARIYLKNKLSFDIFYNDEFKLFDKKYYNHKTGLTAGYNTDEWSSLELEYQSGRNFDRDFWLINATAKAKITPKWSIDFSHTETDFSPDTTNASTSLNVLSTNYYITPDLWVRLFAQTRSNIDLLYIYGLMGWRFKAPFGALYLIYSKDDRLYYPEELKYKHNVLFVKVTYPIDF